MPQYKQSGPVYVPALADRSAPVQQPQRMEARPTFEGQSPVGRLLVFLGVCVGLALALYFLVGVDKVLSMLAGFAMFLLMWVIDNLFATGYLHKRSEQHTEQMRIHAAMMDAASINEAQEEQLQIIWQAIQTMERRLDAMKTVTIHTGTKATVLPAEDSLDMRIKQWIATDIFNANGAQTGVYRNGQIAGKMPFKETSPDGSDERNAYVRLVAAGLVSRDANGNYVWIGPATLPATLGKLSRVGAVSDD